LFRFSSNTTIISFYDLLHPSINEGFYSKKTTIEHYSTSFPCAKRKREEENNRKKEMGRRKILKRRTEYF
jgi:hypothetical protein